MLVNIQSKVSLYNTLSAPYSPPHVSHTEPINLCSLSPLFLPPVCIPFHPPLSLTLLTLGSLFLHFYWIQLLQKIFEPVLFHDCQQSRQHLPHCWVLCPPSSSSSMANCYKVSPNRDAVTEAKARFLVMESFLLATAKKAVAHGLFHLSTSSPMKTGRMSGRGQ